MACGVKVSAGVAASQVRQAPGFTPCSGSGRVGSVGAAVGMAVPQELCAAGHHFQQCSMQLVHPCAEHPPMQQLHIALLCQCSAASRHSG